MINVNENHCVVRGTGTAILAEYAVLTTSLLRMLADEIGKDAARHFIDKAYKLGTTNVDLLKKFGTHCNPTFKSKDKAFDELLKHILEGGKEDE